MHQRLRILFITLACMVSLALISKIVVLVRAPQLQRHPPAIAFYPDIYPRSGRTILEFAYVPPPGTVTKEEVATTSSAALPADYNILHVRPLSAEDAATWGECRNEEMGWSIRVPPGWYIYGPEGWGDSPGVLRATTTCEGDAVELTTRLPKSKFGEKHESMVIVRRPVFNDEDVQRMGTFERARHHPMVIGSLTTEVLLADYPWLLWYNEFFKDKGLVTSKDIDLIEIALPADKLSYPIPEMLGSFRFLDNSE